MKKNILLLVMVLAMICILSSMCFASTAESIFTDIANASSGDIINLEEDIDIGTQIIEINKSLTLDLRGYKLSGKNVTGLPSPVINVNGEDVIFTIQDSSSDADGCVEYYGTSVQGRAINIKAGKFVLKSGIISTTFGRSMAVCVNAGTTFVMEGGKVIQKYTSGNYNNMAVRVIGVGTFEMKDGCVEALKGDGVWLDKTSIFTMSDGLISGDKNSVSIPVGAKNARVYAGTLSGKVSGPLQGPSTLQTSLDALETEDEISITLGDAVDTGEYTIIIPAGKKVTIDLAGKTIDLKQLIVDGELTINDSVGGGKISSSTSGTISVSGGATLNLNAGEIIAIDGKNAITSSGTVKNNGGTITGATSGNIFASSIIQTALDNDEEEVTLTEDIDISKYCILIPAGKKFTINLNGNSLKVNTIKNNGNLSIIGKGTISSDLVTVLVADYDAILYLKDVELVSAKSTVNVTIGKKITIDNCTLTSTSTSDACVSFGTISEKIEVKNSTIDGYIGVKVGTSDLDLTSNAITAEKYGIQISGANKVVNLLENANKVIANTNNAIYMGGFSCKNYTVNIYGGVYYSGKAAVYNNASTSIANIYGGYFGDSTASPISPDTYKYTTIANNEPIKSGDWAFDNVVCQYFVGRMANIVYTLADGSTKKVTYYPENIDEQLEKTTKATYIFRGWEISGDRYTTLTNDLFTLVDQAENSTVIANAVFIKMSSGGSSTTTTKYTITVSCDKNGTISPNENVKVEKGENQEFLFEANEGYEIDKILVDGKSIEITDSYTFENVTKSHKIEVKFKEISKEISEEVSGESSGDVLEEVSEWAKEEVEKAKSNGLVPTALEGKNLTKQISRLEFTAACVKLYEKLTGEVAAPVSENPFTDCTDVEVLKAYNLGITNGMSESTFASEMNITREQMATMLTRTIAKAGIDVTVNTKDIKFADEMEVSDWAVNSVRFMAQSGLINGMGEGKYVPLGTATREQTLAISQRTFEGYKK